MVMDPNTNTSLVPAGATITPTNPLFPFQLNDLMYWVVRRKDGTVVKYVVMGPKDDGPTYPAPVAHHAAPKSNYSLYDHCIHNPTKLPVWEGENFDLYIADSPGTRSHFEEFDFLLDCGDIVTLRPDGTSGKASYPSLLGDPNLVAQLEPFSKPTSVPTRILKIDWMDRQAPPVEPEFWKELSARLYGTVLCSCQGGHGRSGTSLVCLLMVENPEYTPKDAIIHLRAMHCPRAIESVVQHEYIDKVGVALGRVANSDEVKEIQDYKKAFLALDMASAKPYQERLRNK